MAKKTTAKTSSSTAESADNNDSGLFPPHPALSSEFLEAFSEGDTSIGEYSELLESICGNTDDSQPVEQYNGNLGVTKAFVNSHQSCVAQVQWNNNLAAKYTSPGDVNGVRWGTGTMISKDLFITAGHLFDQTGGGWTRPKDNVTHATISPQQIALNMHLNFNYQVDPAGNLRAEVSFPITQLIEYRLGGLDFAICRIGGNPGNTFGINGVSTVDAAKNDMLCIMGHPAGVPKRIEAGPCSNITGNNIFYNDIDTLGGNSGSGILRASTGLLVGVHTNGGCTSSGGENMGFRISKIRAVSPTLQALPAPTNTVLDNITTVAADVIATTVVLDQPTTTVFADSSPTLDVLTLVTTDQPHTQVVIDNLRTQVFIDNMGGSNPALDNILKPVGSDGIGNPFDPIFDPFRGGGGRPFILATPHHIPTPEHEAAAAMQGDYESALAQLAQAIQQSSAQLEALHQQYQQTLAEYQALMFGQ
jgi:V8-like Glu-specific endopeptidase